MDAIPSDSERADRSMVYLRAYDVARERIEHLHLWDDRPDPAAVLRRLVAMIGREVGDDGTARRVIGWAAEDAVAGWRPAGTAGPRPSPGA